MIDEFSVRRELTAFFLGKQVGFDYLAAVRLPRRNRGLQQAEIT
jgi:hypothetical protein